MPAPDITPAQFAILCLLNSGEMAGHELRERLKKERNIARSGPAFYQMMSRLEESKLVRGYYEKKVIGGQAVRERRYKILANGVAEIDRTHAFYQRYALLGGLASA